MAAEFDEITQSNQADLEHIRADLCDLLRIARKFERVADRMLAQYQAPLATMIGRRKARNG